MVESVSNDVVFDPPERVSDGAYFPDLESYQELYSRSLNEPDAFWAEQARTQLHWFHEFSQVSDSDLSNAMNAWFLGGKLNVCYNCVDRHLATRSEKVAILWEGDEPGDVRKITYRELQREVCRLANVLRHNGIRKGCLLYTSPSPRDS